MKQSINNLILAEGRGQWNWTFKLLKVQTLAFRWIFIFFAKLTFDSQLHVALCLSVSNQTVSNILRLMCMYVWRWCWWGKGCRQPTKNCIDIVPVSIRLHCELNLALVIRLYSPRVNTSKLLPCVNTNPWELELFLVCVRVALECIFFRIMRCVLTLFESSASFGKLTVMICEIGYQLWWVFNGFSKGS